MTSTVSTRLCQIEKSTHRKTKNKRMTKTAKRSSDLISGIVFPNATLGNPTRLDIVATLFLGGWGGLLGRLSSSVTAPRNTKKTANYPANDTCHNRNHHPTRDGNAYALLDIRPALFSPLSNSYLATILR